MIFSVISGRVVLPLRAAGYQSSNVGGERSGRMKDIQAVVPPTDAERVLEPSQFSRILLHFSSGKTADPEKCLDVITENSRYCSFLLRYVNGVSTVTANPVASIAETVTKLGTETLANLALFCSFLAQYRHGRCPQFDYQRFWQKSLAIGTAARLLAIHQKIDGDKLFTYGILSRIGELALATAYPKNYGKLLAEGLPHDKKEQEERRLFPFSSSELTSKLLTGWGLSRPCVEAIQQSGDRSSDQQPAGTTQEGGRILYLATQMARICLLELPLAATFIAAEKEAEYQTIPVEQFGPFFNRLTFSWQRICEFFKVPTLHCPNYHQIKTIDDAAMGISHTKPPLLTFLAADDDPMTLIYLKKMLAKENRVLLTAENGDEALAMALEHRPHLLITDWRMPGLSGIELCKILRKTKVTQHMYIIMLTCNESEDELVQAFDAGADDYVVKPFTPKVLQARISSGERLVLYQQTIHRDRETIQRYAGRLAAANRKLQNMAMTDFLTGLPNRRNALRTLKNLVAEVKRFKEPLSCLMIDIDHFKKINDTYGHDCGDIVLKQLSKLLEEKARSYDTVSRWGGEEFLIICARSGPADSCRLAERLRRTVEQYRIRPADDVEISATISVGVASWSPVLGDENALIKEADTLLYLAKKNGRNRVESSSGSLPHSLS